MTMERRKDKRVSANSQVEINGIDAAGVQFTERARLADVGGEGCCILARNSVQKGGIIGVEPLGPEGENLSGEFPRLFIIVRVKREGDFFEIGARCLLEDELCDSKMQMQSSSSKVSVK